MKQGSGSQEKILTDITNLMAQLVAPSVSPPPTGFDFAVASLEVVGNLPRDFLDDFSDGSLTAYPTGMLDCLGTVHDESGGFLHLTSADGANTLSPGFLVDSCFLGGTHLERGSGNAVVTASFRADRPRSDQAYGLQLFTMATQEVVNIQVSNCGARSCVLGLVAQTGFVSSAPVDLNGVATIFLRLTLDGNTGHVVPSFSTDEHGSFTPIALPASAKVFTGANQAGISVFGSVAAH